MASPTATDSGQVSDVNSFARIFPGAKFSEHVALARVACPCWAELKMRFVLDRFPIAAPLQTEISTHCADRFVLWRFIQIFAPFEHANVECDAEIVVRISAAHVGDDLAGLGPALRVKIVLLIIRAQTDNYVDSHCGRCRFWNVRPCPRRF